MYTWAGRSLPWAFLAGVQVGVHVYLKELVQQVLSWPGAAFVTGQRCSD
jgi:hypothetical protein